MADPSHSSPTAAAAGDSLLAPATSDAPEAVLPAAAPDLDAEFGFQCPEIGKEKLAGTVGFHQRHVFLCYKGPKEWPSDVEATDSDRLPRLLAAAIKARKANLKKSIKLTICEREGSESSLGDVLIFPDMIRYRGLTHFDVDNFVEEVFVKDAKWLPGSPERISGSYVFVCAHGSRDKRCGVCGPALITRFKEEIEGQGVSNKVSVRACSHVGGPKCVENVIIFNSDAKGEVTGHWYGYVAPDDVSVLLHKHIGLGEIVKPLWRGQLGMSEEQQKKALEVKLLPAAEDSQHIAKSLVRRDSNPIFHKREWEDLGTHFVEGFYNKLETAPETLHLLYNEKCNVNWVVFEESCKMKTAQEVQSKISLIDNRQKAVFSKKNHCVQRTSKTILVVAHGIYRAEKTYCNFMQSFVLHRRSGLILNDVLLVLCNAVPQLKIKIKTRERNEDATAGISKANLEAGEMGGRQVMLVYNEECLEHIPPGTHDEEPNRISSIMETLQTDGVLRRVLLTRSEAASREQVRAVHTEKHLLDIDKFPLTAEELQLCACISKQDMYSSSGTKAAVYLAAGAVIKACEAVAKDQVNLAFALVRPPGHHASAEFAEGFCYLNNAAIATKYLLSLVQTVMLVDIDAHHGNGSQRVFYDSDAVLFFSTHCSSIGYPPASREKILSYAHTSIGEGNGQGFNVNIPMKEGYGDSEILYAIDEVLAPLVAAFKPGLILVSAGFDAGEGDTVGKKCKVSRKCFGTITKKLVEMGKGKLVMCLEGGYGPNLPHCVSHCLRALLGDNDVCLTKEELSSLPMPNEDARVTVRKLKKLLKKHWNVFTK